MTKPANRKKVGEEKHPRPTVTIGLFLVCVLGTWISGLLLKEHAGPWPTDQPAPSLFSRLCGASVDGESACSAVAKSQWSAIDVTLPTLTRSLSIERSRIVIPVAFMGMAYFVFLGVWFAMAGPRHTWGFWYSIPFLAVSVGVVSSILLVGIMLTKLDVLCSWCFVIHGINAVLAGGVFYLWPRKSMHQPFPTATLALSSVIKTFALAGLLMGGLWVYRNATLETRRQVTKLLPYKRFVEQRQNDPAFLLREFLAVEQHDIPARPDTGQVVLSNDQPQLVVFGDFQCPHCSCFTKRWENEYRLTFVTEVNVSYRHFPIDSECNSEVTGSRHLHACHDSYIAEAARLQGGDEAFGQVHSWLMANGGRVDEDAYETMAARIGLDAQQLIADAESSKVKDTVAADVGLGVSLGVRSTPAVFLNGRRVPSFCLHNPLFWKAVSEEYLTNSQHTSQSSATSSALVAKARIQRDD